ncbi:MAG TPA: hypothetical protein PKE69_01755 [Pyrinomonadaceae bacterium]|nr:hypothetical protein [Pyrinomonadaceae bacterium]
MNLKSIRKNYDALTMRERYSLFWKAIMRNDESETDAIISASPKLNFRIADIAKFADDILTLHLLNLIERLNYSAMFNSFIELSQTKNEQDIENVINNLLLTGYLYRIETDAWKAVGDEFGFDVEVFRERLSNEYFAVELMQSNDALMREFSFQDEGVKKIMKEKKLNPAQMKTLESQTQKYREILITSENRVT